MASTDEGWLVGGDLMDLGGDAPACPAAVDARTPPLVASPLNDITKMANLKPVRTAVPPGSALHRTLSIESKSAGSSPHDGPFPFAPSPVATKAATVKTKFTPTATKMAAKTNAAAPSPVFKPPTGAAVTTSVTASAPSPEQMIDAPEEPEPSPIVAASPVFKPPAGGHTRFAKTPGDKSTSASKSRSRHIRRESLGLDAFSAFHAEGEFIFIYTRAI